MWYMIYGMIYYIYDIWYDVWYDIYDISYMIWYTWYDMIWYTIWCDLMWYDVRDIIYVMWYVIWYDMWYTIYDKIYDIIHHMIYIIYIISHDDMIYRIHFLTAIGLIHGGSSTAHIYTQTVHRTTQWKQDTQDRTYITLRIQKHDIIHADLHGMFSMKLLWTFYKYIYIYITLSFSLSIKA